MISARQGTGDLDVQEFGEAGPGCRSCTNNNGVDKNEGVEETLVWDVTCNPTSTKR